MSGVRFSQDPPVRPRRSGAVFGFRALWTATETTPFSHAGAVCALSASRRRAAASEPVLAPRFFVRGLRCCETARWDVHMIQTSRWGYGASTGSCFRVWCHTTRVSPGTGAPVGGRAPMGGAPTGESSDGESTDGRTASRVWPTEGRETPKSVLWPAGCHRIRQRPTVEV